MLKISKSKKMKPVTCSDSCGCHINTGDRNKLNTEINIDEDIRKVQEELDNVRQVKKCRACECLLDVLSSISTDLEGINTPQAEATRKEMQGWLDEGNKERHGCLGCEECLPIKPYNYFNTALKGGLKEGVSSNEIEESKSCGCGDNCTPNPSQIEITDKWPIVEGDYVIGNPKATIAICTLSDTDLTEELKANGLLERVTIIGTLATENLGIERVIRNLVANPNIGYLLLCGKESRGHKAGQAISSLKDNGVDKDNRIIGAVGPRPVLKNITKEEIEAFRQNIAVIDEIGIRDVLRLAEVVQMCLDKPKGVSPKIPPKVHTPKVVEAMPRSNREWTHDPEGFFVIFLNRDDKKIVCEHYIEEGVINEVIKGANAEDIANTVIKRGLLSRLDHAAYLGRELAKAEAALAFEIAYKQDEPIVNNY